MIRQKLCIDKLFSSFSSFAEFISINFLSNRRQTKNNYNENTIPKINISQQTITL